MPVSAPARGTARGSRPRVPSLRGEHVRLGCGGYFPEFGRAVCFVLRAVRVCVVRLGPGVVV